MLKIVFGLVRDTSRTPSSHGISFIFKLSTSDNAFLAFWLAHLISVISLYTLVWPYAENNNISLGKSGGKKKRFRELSTNETTEKKKKQRQQKMPYRQRQKRQKVWFEIIYLMVLRIFLTNL